MRPLAACILVAALVVVAGCGADESGGTERRADDCPTEGSPIKTLTPKQRSRAIEIAAADPTLKTVLGGSRASVKRVDPWTTVNRLELEGAFVSYRVAPPVTVDHVRVPVTEDPFADSDVDPCVRFLRRSAAVTASDVKLLDVTVDLGESKVVDINLTGPFNDADYTDYEGPEPSDAYRAPEGY